MPILRLYRSPGLAESHSQSISQRFASQTGRTVDLTTEVCYYIQSEKSLTEADTEKLRWLLAETYEPDQLSPESLLDVVEYVEAGPRLSFSTAWSTNAVSICRACGIEGVDRLERSRRYGFSSPLNEAERAVFLCLVHDRMTECEYTEPLTTFDPGIEPDPVTRIPLIEQGRTALEELNDTMGLAFDEWDLNYYSDVFLDKLKRNPTNVECFDIAQSNSEHSRHWFFKGRLVLDGETKPHHLIGLIQETLDAHPDNSIIAFRDNSSAIRGCRIDTLLPSTPGGPSALKPGSVVYHPLLTAETHNFPSGVAPFPGAETGTGGRIRDTHATGRGSLVVAGTAAYCVGNLRIPGYPLPWEDSDFQYPDNLSDPLTIEIEASNGASDYGNKFGEPVIQGYTRSFGLRLSSGERREWIKPIMFSAGVGQIDDRHTEKYDPEIGMKVIKLGGPAYRIGMGGGAASSMVQGENATELDFNAVQRGDAEMAQKVNRVIRSCVELGEDNPIVSIHDQGAGGNCNVLKEIVEPLGARINLHDVHLGDQTLSALEIWGAEYQENDALLIQAEHEDLFQALCDREKVPFSTVGEVTGDGRIVVYDARSDVTPVDLDLESVLGDMPQKTFELDRVARDFLPLSLPAGVTVPQALDRVLRLLSVGSKRFLTNKVDRSVTGLIAQQQCVGPFQLPLSNVAVVAQSHTGLTGIATAIGEQPIKGIVDPAAMARMTIGEALTNIVWASVPGIDHIKCSGNWMYAAKLPGEGADMYDAALAVRDTMIALGLAIDGGKDSLSMAAIAPTEGGDETVKAPGTFVVSAYAACDDITLTVTTDLKQTETDLLYVDLGAGKNSLGGSALAHVYGQVGNVVPDLNDTDLVSAAFRVTQKLIREREILAGHDRSDGGLLTTVLEMAFAGNIGVSIDTNPGIDTLEYLFNEELGLVLEVSAGKTDHIIDQYTSAGVPCTRIGGTTDSTQIIVTLDGETVLTDSIENLQDTWEATSYQLERLQVNPDCADKERETNLSRCTPAFSLSFAPSAPATVSDGRPQIAIVREEGSNGDREMASAFHLAGFEPWDISTADLANGRATLDGYHGIAFVGGFSYADVLDSAKGWAGVIRYNERVLEQMRRFRHRADTFSLGVCNGCQLMALLGWVPGDDLPDTSQPRFVQNQSGRFESRFSTVRVPQSPAIMLSGMADSVLGVWVAHGEGRAYFPDPQVQESVERRNLVALRYADDSGVSTETYPLNPNGSPDGIAGLCSEDGRHLAMMPHPERAFLKWQWGWMPPAWNDLEASPWLRMFQNAKDWCDQT
ncbi:MAG: phosphoribosylformylglycinamidine synthase [Gemmatimonadetes bacterium]|nr:phosphoribosylformylglycinamidine synthase [Gemmatimonadota bacterium]